MLFIVPFGWTDYTSWKFNKTPSLSLLLFKIMNMLIWLKVVERGVLEAIQKYNRNNSLNGKKLN